MLEAISPLKLYVGDLSALGLTIGPSKFIGKRCSDADRNLEKAKGMLRSFFLKMSIDNSVGQLYSYVRSDCRGGNDNRSE